MRLSRVASCGCVFVLPLRTGDCIRADATRRFARSPFQKISRTSLKDRRAGAVESGTPPNIPMTRSHTPCLAPLLAALSLATFVFQNDATASEPVAQLISHTLDKTTPNATFNIRFAKPMVDASSVGKTADPAPVELHPAVKGTFTWLSTRSGAFVPDEPLPLRTPFRFS